MDQNSELPKPQEQQVEAAPATPETRVATGPNPAGPDAPLEGFKPMSDGSLVTEAKLAEASAGHPVDTNTAPIQSDGKLDNPGTWLEKANERNTLKAASATEPQKKPWWKSIFHISEEKAGQPTTNSLIPEQFKDGKTPEMTQVAPAAAQAVEATAPVSATIDSTPTSEAAPPPPAQEPVANETAAPPAPEAVKSETQSEEEATAPESVITDTGTAESETEPTTAPPETLAEAETDSSDTEKVPASTSSEAPSTIDDSSSESSKTGTAEEAHTSEIATKTAVDETSSGMDSETVKMPAPAESVTSEPLATNEVTSTVESSTSTGSGQDVAETTTTSAFTAAETDGADKADDMQPTAKVDTEEDQAIISEPSAEDKDVTKVETDTLVANSTPEYHPPADIEEESLSGIGQKATTDLPHTGSEDAVDTAPLPLVDTPKVDDEAATKAPITAAEADATPVALDTAVEPDAHEDPSTAVTATASAAGTAPTTAAQQPITPPPTITQPLENPTIEPYAPPVNQQTEDSADSSSKILQFPSQPAAEEAASTKAADTSAEEANVLTTQPDKPTQPEEKPLAA